MPVRLSDDELAAMEGLPHMHRCLYIFGIRRYMDYETGITGIKRGISWQSLREELYVEPHQGRLDTGSISKDQVRRAAEYIEKKGLITIMSEGKRLIFKCVLATQDKSVQNKPATNPPHQPAIEPDTSNANAGERLLNKPTIEPAIPTTPKPATPPVSGKDITTTNTSAPDFENDPMRTWKEFFIGYGYKFNILTNANVNRMCMFLIESKLEIKEVQNVIANVNEVRRGSGNADLPTSPCYYLPAIKDYIEVKKNPKSQDISSGKQSSRSNHYADDKRARKQRYDEIGRELEEDYRRATQGNQS